MFVPIECNKVAFASSFGVATIPNNQTKKTREYLNRIQHISVREESGQKIVKELTGREVPILLDPTMIITKEEWDKSIPDNKIIGEDYIFCYFLGNNPTHRKEAQELSESTGLKIVTLRHLDEYIPRDESFGDIAPYDVGPAEFVNLIRHARYVCTDSFHGSVFSIIYHIPFISFNRFAEGNNSRNSRLDTLFHNIGLSRRFNKNIVDEMLQPINYKKVDKRIQELRLFAHNFIVQALCLEDSEETQCSKENEREEHVICPKEKCTGCEACASVCPKYAITIELDDCGFYRPFIDNALCIRCNSCNRICPINKTPIVYGPTQAFAYQNSDEIRFNSTSGGFFNALANRIIDEGGVVCGAAFDSDMVLKHVFADSKESLSPLQRSKYVQSSMNGVYKRIEDYLNSGRKVLFAGVGCQAAAIRNFIGENENLIVLDVVCYGVPSSGLFQDWIRYLSNKYDKVQDVRFRDKSYGYATPNVRVIFQNGKYIESTRDSSIYAHLFFRNLSIRESCYDCHFKSIDRASDITLGDLWSINNYYPSMDDNKGTTVAFAHTKKGLELCKIIGCKEIDTENVIKSDSAKMVVNVSPAKNTNGFWKKYREDGFEAMASLYEKDTLKNKLRYFLKNTMNKANISQFYYKYDKQRKLKDQK